MSYPVKSLGYIKSYNSSSPIPIKKALVILSDTTDIRSAVDWEDLKWYWNFSRWSTSLLFKKFFKDIANHRQKTNRLVVFCHTLFSNILKYGDHWWDLPTIWKTRFLQTDIERFILYAWKFRVTVPHFFRNTTGIQSGLDALDKLRLILTFSTNFEVTEILCSFRLVLEGKTSKEISESSRLEFLKKFLANNFALSDTEQNTSIP